MASSIPLLCNICPKEPRFSDVSHLLTHVSSKGHLSHYFKTTVRSSQEPDLREKLNSFDQWFAEWDVEKLLSNRMALKGTKNSQQAAKRLGIKLPSAGARFPKSNRQQGPSTQPQSLLDPQLTHQVPPDSHSTSSGPASPYASMPRSRVHEDITGNRPITTNVSVETLLSDSSEDAARKDDKIDQVRNNRAIAFGLSRMFCPDPPIVSNQPGSITDSPRSVRSLSNNKRSLTGFDSERFSPADEEDEGGECTRLKGICWPGMAIFDSASPDAKRLRNQKKDGSIVEQMKITSATVQPLEQIYFPDGFLKVERPITGQVESSPIREEIQKSRSTRPRATRVPLGELSTNIPTHRPTGQSWAGAPRNDKSLRKPSRNLAARGPNKRRQCGLDRNQSRGIRQAVVPDPEIEWRLNAGGLGRDRTRGFRIFNDHIANPLMGQEPSQWSFPTDWPDHFEEQGQNEHSYVRPQDTSNDSLLSIHMNTASTVGSVEPHMGGNGKVPLVSSNSAARATNIETARRLYQREVERDFWSSGADHSTQRYFTAQGLDAPQFFETLPPHMNCGVFGSSNHSFQPLNPLAYNLDNHNLRRNERPTDKSISNANMRKTRAGGPASDQQEDSDDDTISESNNCDMLLGEED